MKEKVCEFGENAISENKIVNLQYKHGQGTVINNS